jgi:hypothetical protein
VAKLNENSGWVKTKKEGGEVKKLNLVEIMEKRQERVCEQERGGGGKVYLYAFEDHGRDAVCLAVDKIGSQQGFWGGKSLPRHSDGASVRQCVVLNQVRCLPAELRARSGIWIFDTSSMR